MSQYWHYNNPSQSGCEHILLFTKERKNTETQYTLALFASLNHTRTLLILNMLSPISKISTNKKK